MFSDSPVYEKDVRDVAALPLPWKKLRGSVILISGASGMIGTFLTDVLMERGYSFHEDIHVVMLGRSEARMRKRFQKYLEEGKAEFVVCDVNQGVPAGRTYDHVFHCAGNTHPVAYAEDPVGTILTNVLGTRNMLEAAVKGGARRMVFLSSVEIYGENSGPKLRLSEEDCGYLDCNTLRAGYPEGKRTGEALCQAYVRKYGLDVVIPRVCRVFGPTMLESDSKALSQFIRNAVKGEDIVLKSDGMQYYSYCYVADVVSALFYILFLGKRGEAYNIADEKSDIHLKDLAEMLARISGRKVIFDLPEETESRGFSKATRALLDAGKLKRLGWKAELGIGKQLEKTVAVLKSMR